jgi:hypothetical protein
MIIIHARLCERFDEQVAILLVRALRLLGPCQLCRQFPVLVRRAVLMLLLALRCLRAATAATTGPCCCCHHRRLATRCALPLACVAFFAAALDIQWLVHPDVTKSQWLRQPTTRAQIPPCRHQQGVSQARVALGCAALDAVLQRAARRAQRS